MYLTGLIHRDTLFSLVNRWFSDQLEPGDGRFITEVFIFESMISGPSCRNFLQEIHNKTVASPVSFQRIFLKDDLRQKIIRSSPLCSQRAKQLFRRYSEAPEELFPRTPVHLLMSTASDGSLLGMTRLKRVKRLAEKASRRVADRLEGSIRRAVKTIRLSRAYTLGLPPDMINSNKEEEAADFAEAERVVSGIFKEGGIVFEPEDLRVDDMIGFKFIGAPDELENIEGTICESPNVTLVEREVHNGKYCDINLLIDIELPPVGVLIDNVRNDNLAFAKMRGLDAPTLVKDFQHYVETGARTFRAEIILTTFEELVESEFGRAIHEERILEQRKQNSYAGRIGQNASFLIEYLMMLAMSPTTEIDHLPIKMWGRYLPDVFSMSVWKLFGIDYEVPLFDFFDRPFSPFGELN